MPRRTAGEQEERQRAGGWQGGPGTGAWLAPRLEGARSWEGWATAREGRRVSAASRWAATSPTTCWSISTSTLSVGLCAPADAACALPCSLVCQSSRWLAELAGTVRGAAASGARSWLLVLANKVRRRVLSCALIGCQCSLGRLLQSRCAAGRAELSSSGGRDVRHLLAEYHLGR